ncbi:hypothetical protein GLOTRDRAFT_111972 [Gloeophyllum trabeum ATCC 11539]|uniref:BRCT domain-containing protein n=1 Tax=Gloeophyllum trabeum (strain ATCC 11539 / FP-39264 / Madison 617) TaxID=670483 RepID=S7PXZ5_GLOTA|nr:uncharacterized protein GLOTRDRAFT_111972 [Gloeophyllum trabeum ATCC 11539]EPQ52481.1 hypothetical protein GLOTRDRAFT_111972 [Gloeophyllum trabeum ATCC 11539]
MSKTTSVIDLTVDSPAASPSRPKLPCSTKFAGKSFYITGTWVTMTADHARELCRANGGRVVSATSESVDYIVLGAKGTLQHVPLAKPSQKLTEREFLDMILAEDAQATMKGRKRPAQDENEPVRGAPSKPAKKSRTSDAGPEAVIGYKRVQDFICNGYVELKGKTLKAYDCGGEVYKAQRGKSIQDLLSKFEAWLEECDGEYHYRMMKGY